MLERLSIIPANLEKADREKLAHAIRQTVQSITIGTDPPQTGKISYKALFGELTLRPAFGIAPIPIPDEAIAQRRIWRELG